MAREVRDALKGRRKVVEKLDAGLTQAQIGAQMLVGGMGSSERAMLDRQRQRLEGMKAALAKLVLKTRCDCITGSVTKRCDRLMGHAGEHLYSDTPDHEWEPRIPAPEMGGSVRA